MTVEGLLIDAALRKICGMHRREYNPTALEADDTDDHVFHEGAAGWMQWACGVGVSFDAPPAGRSHHSELNRMALSQWLQAIGHLQTGNPIEAQRVFRRAITLGGLYGTVSNPTIQWTYAASFFPRNG